MKEGVATALRALLMIGVVALGLFTLGAGWAGIEHAHSWGWGLAAVAAALLFRFTLPISYGVFLCARDIWDLHWFVALLIAMPSLLLMIPGLVAAAFAAFRKR